MRTRITVILAGLILLFAACEGEKEVGLRKVEYELLSSSDFNITGKIKAQELNDGGVELRVDLENVTGEDGLFPVHLHQGHSGTDGVILKLLPSIPADNPVSILRFDRLDTSDEPFSFQDFLSLEANLRVHLDDGAFADVVLCFSNVGRSFEELGSGEMPPSGHNNHHGH